MGVSSGLAAWQLAFEISPVILTGGIAQNIPGQALPIIAITEAANFITGLLSGGSPLDLNSFFAHFRPIPGGTLIDQQIGKYPFANQTVAANATIQQPLTISMLMVCPAKGTLGWPVKLVTLIALQKVLSQHNQSGGTYTVVTPGAFYPNLIMTRMSDASVGESAQPQNAWKMDFEQPLLTLQQAAQAQNALMSKISAGTPFNGIPSSSGLAANISPAANPVMPSIVPAGTGAAGSGLPPY